ncbi:MAG TPA: hypothetical protein ENG89_02265 [Candidatus Moranbacteria bacterium]|nr:hypothetical protein [Candidatus Moranbacteria bacterium]
MLLSTHSLTGAVVGKTFNNVWIIIILSIVLHYIIDVFRHGEYLNRNSKLNEFWKVAVDIIIGLAILGIIIYFSDLSQIKTRNVLIGTFFSMFPDLLTFLYWKLNFNFLKKSFDLHAWVHRYPPFSKGRDWNLKNAANDIILSLIAIALLLL